MSVKKERVIGDTSSDEEENKNQPKINPFKAQLEVQKKQNLNKPKEQPQKVKCIGDSSSDEADSFKIGDVKKPVPEKPKATVASTTKKDIPKPKEPVKDKPKVEPTKPKEPDSKGAKKERCIGDTSSDEEAQTTNTAR